MIERGSLRGRYARTDGQVSSPFAPARLPDAMR